MSAIAAIWHRHGRPVAPGELDALMAAVRHRSPDGEAAWSDGAVGLACGRFDTTPEAARERQPVRSPDGRVVLVMDGRVDNRAELQAGTAAAGCPPRTDGDAELVLQAYLAWGTACPARLLGDWAVAIWDDRLGQLFFARDPFGVRPLFYWADDETIVLGSEPQQVQRPAALPGGVDWGVVGEYLCNQWLADEATMYAGVRRLPGGHAAVCDRAGLRRWRHWPAGEIPPVRYRRPADYEAHFRELLGQSIADRLRSTGPVGILLSGGLDSSSIACLADRMAAAPAANLPPLACLSVTYPGLECDEAAFINAVAQSLAMPAHRVVWNADPARRPDLAKAAAFPNVLFDPGTFAAVLAYAPAAAAGGMRVLLDGIGGDELFSVPQPNLVDPLRAGQLRLAWRRARAAADAGTAPWRVLARHGLWPLVPRPARRAWGGLRRRVRPRHQRQVKPWISASFAARTHLEERLGRAPPTGPVIRSEAKQLVANLLTTSYNAVFALEWNDLVAARLGLEKRHPYWDRRLAEFCLAIPESVRVGEGGADQVTKLLLRRSLCGILPEAIARRRSKPAFDEVSRQEITVLQAPGVDAAIAEARLERLQVLVPGAEQRLLAAYRLGNAGAAAPLTTVLGLELWLLNLEEDLHGP